MLNELPASSGPGISGIPTKILKTTSIMLIPILKRLFNDCITSNKIPAEWKSAIVTPIYKQKGSIEDLNNFRGISVISPIAKLFEKILASQIVEYINKERILFNGQHGFRRNHSCETALHELLSDMNTIRSNREIGVFLFVDFRKAFDLVDSRLLLHKLKMYGFNENTIKLLTNYFTDRTQMVKFDNFISTSQPIKLSVPQGSVLGPLFFLLFINDLPKYVKSAQCKMFADDTTLYNSNKNSEALKISFDNALKELNEWCQFNRVDINWSKTYCMFINKTRNFVIPKFVTFEEKKIETVESFKLLGITIDNKLCFAKQSSEIRNNVNKRLYSIKKIFYLPYSVKIQFFKTFLLPYFDYCSTLIIYFSKDAIQKLANTYNQCLYKLLNVKHAIEVSNDYNILNNKLEKVRLANYQHRVINQLTICIQDIKQ